MRNAFLLEALRLAAGRRDDAHEGTSAEPSAEASGAAGGPDPPEARALRERLVEIVSREVRAPHVLAALRAVPRHRFVPGVPFDEAYGDHPVPIGYGATISQPTVVGLMSEALELSGRERVLEIGTGSGYQAAVLCKLAHQVDSIEVVPALGERASRALVEMGCTNVRVHVGDGWKGYPEGAPYDRIVVTAAPDHLPEALVEQLAEGGLLVVPVGPQSTDQRLERFWKKEGKLLMEDLGAVRFVPMVHRD
jgi:protein-L-isoaspartate(D-aspartate) O-methyltransferase